MAHQYIGGFLVPHSTLALIFLTRFRLVQLSVPWVNGSMGHGSWVWWTLGHGYVTQGPFRILMSFCPVLLQLTHHLCHSDYTHKATVSGKLVSAPPPASKLAPARILSLHVRNSANFTKPSQNYNSLRNTCIDLVNNAFCLTFLPNCKFIWSLNRNVY